MLGLKTMQTSYIIRDQRSMEVWKQIKDGTQVLLENEIHPKANIC